ncbi:MAG: zf-HC2 domain-containing protein, partial [Candidatus Krumholzibacteria bacterium]|nr:zf-HC2 domain-containing protein [Candidatus Krumholzibacteria bacterium]
MNRCTDHKIGDLLHAFELDQLDAEQQEAFELHLLSCDHCFEQVSRFEGVASLLRSDADVQELVRSAATALEPETERESLWSRLLDALWPKTTFLLKPVVSYLIVILLAFPAYVGLR